MVHAFLMAALTGFSVAAASPFMSDEVFNVGAPDGPEAVQEAPPKPVLTLPIQQVESPNQDDRPAGTAIDTLIVHDTETPGVQKATTIANWFLNPKSEVSAHYVIGKAGEIVQCVPDEKRAWHAGPSHFEGREKVNDFSIGIELVNAQTGSDPFTDAQYASLIALTADLVSRYNIPLTRITGHRHVTNYPELKRDPADNFDWERYLVGVQEMLASRQVVRSVTPLVPIGVVGGSGGR
jgi:N-acetyl-anhydromuramyl-L-alanine amidase AmpD